MLETKDKFKPGDFKTLKAKIKEADGKQNKYMRKLMTNAISYDTKKYEMLEEKHREL
jgi:hypothetical protein